MVEQDLQTSPQDNAGDSGRAGETPQSVQKPLHDGHSSTYSVLVVGTEIGLFSPGSTPYERIRRYGACFSNLDLIVLCRIGDASGTEKISENTHAYPTLSQNAILFGLDALRIARKLQKADVVTVQDPFETGLIGFFIAKRMGVPLHVQVHTDFLSPAFARHSIFNRIRVRIARFVLKRASGIRVVSALVKDSLIAGGYGSPDSFSILPIFTDLEQFRSLQVDEVLAKRFTRFGAKLLVVSRLEREKNVSLALRSFAKASPKSSCLIIVGDGREKDMLQRLSQALGVGKRVFFEGTQDPRQYYALADLVLAPSLYEGYGRVIIEALAAGKPVLSTDVGIAREAGAITADQKHFAEVLAEWFKDGPRQGTLKNYPYQNIDAYVHAYCDDIVRCVHE